jgi:HD-GYP domain-containing protein (c-di-GMP phosphodiesterase class II)
MRPVGAALLAMARAKQTAAHFGSEHPLTARAVAEVHDAVTRWLEQHGTLRVLIHEEVFYVEKTLLLEDSVRLDTLLTEMTERGVGLIEVRPGVQPWELGAFLDFLNLPAPQARRIGALAFLRQQHARHIVVRAVRVLADDELAGVRRDPQDVYRAGLRVVDDLYLRAANAMPLLLKRAHHVVNALIDVLGEDPVTLQAQAAFRAYDETSRHHPVHVAVLSLLVGLRAGLERGLLGTLGLSALLHDIGKTRVPREVLLKPDRLSADERAAVARHTVEGAYLLRGLAAQARLAMVVAFEHHANFDLSGYPAIGAKRAQNPLARVVQVAEFYDAATHAARGLRRPMLASDAVRFILARAGELFDPVVAQVFARVVGFYPVGSLVALDSGELAVVVRPPARRPDRPVVRVVRERTGRPASPRVVDLEAEPERTIVGVQDPDLTPDEVEPAVYRALQAGIGLY